MGCLFGALLLPLGGCADVLDRAGERSGDSGPAASPSPSLTGTTDPAGGGVKLTGDVDGSTMEIITIGNDVYFGGLVEEGRYVHAQVSKFKDTAIALLYLIDPLFGYKFLGTATSVVRGEPNTFTGTLDLTRVATTGPAQRLAVSFAKAAGATATALPFTATAALPKNRTTEAPSAIYSGP